MKNEDTNKFYKLKLKIVKSNDFKVLLNSRTWFCFSYEDTNKSKVYVEMKITNIKGAIEHLEHYLNK